MNDAPKRKRTAAMSAIAHSMDDMAANEAGRLSEAQIAGLEWLANERMRPIWSDIKLASLLLLLNPCFLLMASTGAWSGLFLCALPIIGGGAIIVGNRWWQARTEPIQALRHDAQMGQVKSITGRVTTAIQQFPDKLYVLPVYGYTLYIEGLALQADYTTYRTVKTFSLDPYTINYTPRSRVAVLVKHTHEQPPLAEVDPLLKSPTGSKAAMNEYTHALTTSLALTVEDVNLNREGQISPAQVTKLNQLIRQYLRATVLQMGITSFPIVVGIVLYWLEQRSSLPTGEWLPLLLILTLCFAATALFPVWRLRNLIQDVHHNRVEAVDGAIIFDKPGRTFLIGDARFDVAPETYRLLQQGDPYTVYFAPRSRVVLGMEWLGASPFIY